MRISGQLERDARRMGRERGEVHREGLSFDLPHHHSEEEEGSLQSYPENPSTLEEALQVIFLDTGKRFNTDYLAEQTQGHNKNNPLMFTPCDKQQTGFYLLTR